MKRVWVVHGEPESPTRRVLARRYPGITLVDANVRASALHLSVSSVDVAEVVVRNGFDHFDVKPDGSFVASKRAAPPLAMQFAHRCADGACSSACNSGGDLDVCMEVDDESTATEVGGVQWHYCDIDGCNYKSNRKSVLKRHKEHVHCIGVLWHYCDVDGCDHKSKQKGDLKEHKAHIHCIGVIWHYCDVDGCDYKAKSKGNLAQHKANVHDIGIVWYYCNVDGCDHKAKRKSSLIQHKAYVHNIEVVWHYCDADGCDYKAKQSSTLKTHKANVHDIGVVWHYCDVDGCDYKAKQSGTLTTHKADVHDIGVVWSFCDVEGCCYKAKQISKLNRHKANAHSIGVVWHVCDVEGCNYKTKQKGNLTVHKADMHDINVVWNFCGIDGCNFKAKNKCNLNRHKADVHDINVVWHFCDVKGCDYRSKQTGVLSRHMCAKHNDVYVARKKLQEERVRVMLLSAGYQECFATANMPPVGFFKREKRIDFKCANVQSSTQYSRIDFVLSLSGGLVFLEVDENQHQYGYDASISCDMKRMSHVMETLQVELGDALSYIYWLRYNPNACRVDGELLKVRKDEREKRLVAWLRQFEATQPLEIGYAFYDTNDDRLDVLDNEEYHAVYASVVENLGEMYSATGDH